MGNITTAIFNLLLKIFVRPKKGKVKPLYPKESYDPPPPPDEKKSEVEPIIEIENNNGMIDKVKFYSEIRKQKLFGTLKQSQVDGIDAILNATPENFPVKHLAYCLATAKLETADTMQPIHEYGGAAYFNKRYAPATRVGKQLGNIEVGDGALFAGRGYVQLTGRNNYKRAGDKLGKNFIKHPDEVMEANNAAKIMFEGMTEGWFTGKKLSHYLTDTKTDFVNARKIINGLDKAEKIAEYATKFLASLSA